MPQSTVLASIDNFKRVRKEYLMEHHWSEKEREERGKAVKWMRFHSKASGLSKTHEKRLEHKSSSTASRNIS